MANKLRLITDLYGETLTQISDSPNEWMKFLITASNNYKYSFNDQVLIYAQRPEAKACADIDTWNRNVGRWVNRGSKGIALIILSMPVATGAVMFAEQYGQPVEKAAQTVCLSTLLSVITIPVVMKICGM